MKLSITELLDLSNGIVLYVENGLVDTKQSSCVIVRIYCQNKSIRLFNLPYDRLEVFAYLSYEGSACNFELTVGHVSKCRSHICLTYAGEVICSDWIFATEFEGYNTVFIRTYKAIFFSIDAGYKDSSVIIADFLFFRICSAVAGSDYRICAADTVQL